MMGVFWAVTVTMSCMRGYSPTVRHLICLPFSSFFVPHSPGNLKRTTSPFHSEAPQLGRPDAATPLQPPLFFCAVAAATSANTASQ